MSTSWPVQEMLAVPRKTLQRFLDLPEKCAHSETSAGFDRPPEDAVTLSSVEAGDKIFARCSAQACPEAALHLLRVCESFVEGALLGRWKMPACPTYREPGSHTCMQEASALTFEVWNLGCRFHDGWYYPGVVECVDTQEDGRVLLSVIFDDGDRDYDIGTSGLDQVESKRSQ